MPRVRRRPNGPPIQSHGEKDGGQERHGDDAAPNRGAGTVRRIRGALGDGPDGVPLLMLLGATSVLSVPLTDGEHAYGVLTLARWAGHPHFEIADVGLVEELGEQLALAIRVDRMFRHRADIADALQTSLLPRQVRQIPGTVIAGAHVAAAMAAEASGDFYDVYPT